MNSKERIYGTLGIDYQDSGFKAVGAAEAGVNVLQAMADFAAMSSQMPEKSAVSASKSRQSTPIEILEWLNGRTATPSELKEGILPYPNKKAFVRELVGEELRAFIVKKEVRTEVYRYRVVGGEFGTSDRTTLVNMLPGEAGQGFDRVLMEGKETSIPLEYDDEWESHYSPVSNPDRFTVGGTALFDELRDEIALVKLMQEEPEIELSPSELAKQRCEWYPDGEHLCGAPITHARKRNLAAVCDACFAARELRGN